MDYDHHLQSAYWLSFRQRVFERDAYCCVLCDSPEDLECHHRTYIRFGKEELRDCYTLCHACHIVVTDHQRRTRFAGRMLPALQDTTMLVLLHAPSTYTEVILETSTVVSVDGRRTAHDALWTTRRPLEPLDESAESCDG